MDQVKIRQSAFRKIELIVPRVDNHSTTPLSLSGAKLYLQRVREAWAIIDGAHQQLIEQAADDAAERIQQVVWDRMYAVYNDIEMKIIEIIDSLHPVGSSAPTPSGVVNVKLPAITLPTFAGGHEHWLSFKDLFNASVDKRTDLAPSQKLHYLKSALQGEAASILKSLSITDSNYIEAWKLLKGRYDNEREIVHTLVNKLFEQRKLVTESVSDLRTLIDNTNECISSLKVLNRPTDHWDDLLVVITVNKLDEKTRREWAIRQTGTNLPTFQELLTFLETHIRGLMASGSGGSTSTSRDKKREKHVKVHHAAATTNASASCHVCSGVHLSFQCPELIKLTSKERSSKVGSLQLCFNCLNKDHNVKNCKSTRSCKKCGKRHHTLLHHDQPSNAHHGTQATSVAHNSMNGQPEVTASSQGVSSHHVGSSSSFQSQLMTAVVDIQDASGHLQPCRAFIDPGSTADFISEACVNRLRLKRGSSSVTVTGFGGATVGTARGQVTTTLYSKCSSSSLVVNFHIMPVLTHLLPAIPSQRNWNHFKGIRLADPEWYKPGPIDLLIGIKHYHDIMKKEKRRVPGEGPVACESIFGWIISGSCPAATSSSIQSYHVTVDSDRELLQKFWETEEPPSARILTQEEKLCEKHFQDTYMRDHQGRFVVQIPFNDKRKLIGYSRSQAVKRQLSVERRLSRVPDLKQQYVEFMREYLQLGHMEQVPEEEMEEVPGRTYYLPHHCVTNENSSTTKLRVVFDASCKSSSGISLNDAMLVGATLQDDLFDILLRFRQHQFVIKADVTKMFRQFKLTKEHSDMHRIVWRDNPDQPLKDYRLMTITYGTASATYLSTRCLQQLGKDVAEKYPAASSALQSSMYIDDLMHSAATSNDIVTLYNELTNAVKEGGLQLRKWSTNCPNLFDMIPEELRETKAHAFEEESCVKALGVQWQPSSDVFSFSKIEFDESIQLTMRRLLAEVARVFDPLGLISCITVRGKLFIQEMWKLNLHWDDQVPDYLMNQWQEYKEDLQQISSLTIPRCLRFTDAITYEIHAFCDASEKAICGIVYMRAVHPDGEITVTFITSKTRVAPIKQVSLPRLELNAAVLVSELADRVKSSLKLTCDAFFWSDSTITLRWIAASPRRWDTYVANRVAKIQELTLVEMWRHVPGVQNPADLGSRGVCAGELNNKFWWNGPEWLATTEIPRFIPPPIPSTTKLEERKTPLLVSHVEVEASLLTRYSTLRRLQRVTSYILRFIKNAKMNQKSERETGPISPKELRSALMLWVRYVQQHHFKEDIDSLLKNSRVPVNSNLRTLYPYIDTSGILRVSGRLHNANLSEESKHQMILPSNNKLTELIIRQVHHDNFHSGFTLTWSSLLSQFWIVRGRDKVRHIIRSCVTCRRYRSKVAEQLMGNLPTSRVTPCRPFLHSGVDYAGPFTLKNPVGRPPKTYKGYLCIFVCMVTKAIHLEAVSSLSTDAFIASLRRFVSRRGLCSDIYSDCGTNFVGAEKELKRYIRSRSTNDVVADAMASDGVRWHFNPPSSPHHGGLWEAGVKSAKFHLRRVIGNACLTFEHFSTLLAQIEAVLNSRPLYPASSDPGDLNALTPGHFLVGDSLRALPDERLENVKFSRLSIFQQQQQRLQHFWQRWSREYLNTLQQKNKWYWERENMKPGDLVLLIEETSPGFWKMARVIDTKPGSDGKVRVVTIKTATSTLERPIVKLVPLISEDK